MARAYHPDKNPEGRPMFEKVRAAYELLSSVEFKITKTDLGNVITLLNTQIIIYHRHAADVAEQKYSGYHLLLQIIQVPTVELAIRMLPAMESGSSSSPTDKTTSKFARSMSILFAGIKLAFYTVSVSPHSSEEFVKVGGLPKLLEVYYFSLGLVERNDTSDMSRELLTYSLKTLSIILEFETGRLKATSLCPDLTDAMYRTLALNKKCPLAFEKCVLSIVNSCASKEMQAALVSSGVFWRLVPLLLTYDGTLQDDEGNESLRIVYNQHAANAHAVLAARALGRLAGVMFDELASPENPYVRSALERLLTHPIARMLRNRRPWEMLQALNENVEKPSKIWNSRMRAEVLSFVQQVEASRPPGSRSDDLAAVKAFDFVTVKSELVLDGIYLRLFVNTRTISDIENPSKFSVLLIDEIHKFLKGKSSVVPEDHQMLLVETLKIISEDAHYVAGDISRSTNGVNTVLMLISLPSESPLLPPAIVALKALTADKAFVSALSARPVCVTALLRCICSTSLNRTSSSTLWA
eukprot:gene9732-12490_t